MERKKITRQRFLKYSIDAALLSCLFYKIGVHAEVFTIRNEQLSGNSGKGTGRNMTTPVKISEDFKSILAMKYSPVGFYFTENKPEGAGTVKNSGEWCIMPRVLAGAKGRTYAFEEKSLPSCAAFFLGYRDRLFLGAEYYLSHAPLAGSLCERFVKTPKLAKKYLEVKKYPVKSKGFAVFKPLEQFSEAEKSETVIFFGNPDQLSGLVYLLYFGAPLDDSRVVAGFASGCGSVVTLPLQYARKGMKKAVWGLHDISARANLPADLMTITMPFDLLVEIWKDIKKSFLITEKWNKIARRIARDNNETQGGKNKKNKFRDYHATDARYKKCNACH
ncbi:MAG: DUF169 domain-containing protein [Spirochaetes bacterium]|nr:DUF169 domain-containing protein [Spirochaetota bacterium]